ncbi:flagellar biosynthetic protein FliR [Desulfobulbus rhabdoformis]|uniref:flagellar biosynthetic protein FliR n=1 Tax=Desulfobulbus rhabdoformis TaxID=34032 RepID=UPI00196432E9|nr:flagellar biosynthetic protein FliR [Desulfobulbus rhabdoformis]MBM9616491.1 flagellar biosynthetic protein FliR [Desulfobulbus rhabdoformis]
MDLLFIGPEHLQSFFICLARVMALVTAIPVFAGIQMTARIKIGIAVMTSLLLFPAMLPYMPQAPLSLTGFAIIIVNEVIVGTMIALVSQMVIAAASFGGTVIGYQMGFAAANIFDPQTTQQLSLMSQFINVLALLAFLSFNVHHYYFQAMVDSFRLLPPGFLDFSGGAVEELMRLGSRMFSLGIKFSAPVLALLLLANLVLGILARVFPQLNVFMISFPLNIGISFLVIGLTLGATFSVLRREFDTMIEHILQVLSLLSP